MAIDKKYVEDCISRLTPREKEILYWKCHGKTNDQISEELVISINTVNDHFRDIYPKLGVEFQERKGRLDKLQNIFCPLFLEIYTPPETVVEE